MKLVWNEIKRHQKRFLHFFLVPISVCWLVTEPALAFMPDLPIKGFPAYFILILISLFYAVFKMIPLKEVELKIKHSNTSIRIAFEDLFNTSDYKVIPVNEFFDYELGNHVSERSVHGMFIKDVLGRNSQTYCTLVENALKEVNYQSVERPNGCTKKYEIGTTAVIETHGSKYFLVALARTEINTLKANASVADLVLALEGLWKTVRDCCNGSTISIPLMGSGLSNIGLSPNDLLRIIIISILAETKKSRITEQINIVLRSDLIHELNLGMIKEEFDE